MQELMAWSVFGLFVCNFLTLLCLTVIALKVIQVLKQVQNNSVPAIASAQSSLSKIENLAKSTEEMMRESVTPVLTNVKHTTQAVSQSAEGVRRVVGRVEDAVSKPIRLIAAAGNALDTPAGKAGILALGLGVARFAMRSNQAKHNSANQAIVHGRTNGASATTVR